MLPHNDKANLPGPLQRLQAARNRTAAPVKFSDWLAGVVLHKPALDELHEIAVDRMRLKSSAATDRAKLPLGLGVVSLVVSREIIADQNDTVQIGPAAFTEDFDGVDQVVDHV